MLGSNPGLLRLWHWKSSDDLTSRLDLAHCILIQSEKVERHYRITFKVPNIHIPAPWGNISSWNGGDQWGPCPSPAGSAAASRQTSAPAAELENKKRDPRAVFRIRIRIRIHRIHIFLGIPDPKPSTILLLSNKIVGKTLILTVLWLFLDFLCLKNDVNVPSKSNKQKTFLN